MARSKQLGVRLPIEVAEWLEEAAAADDRTASAYIRRIVEAEMRRQTGRTTKARRMAKPKTKAP
jgi:predicted DNA-binding protein